MKETPAICQRPPEDCRRPRGVRQEPADHQETTGHHGPIASRQAADSPFHLITGWQLSNTAASASSHATAPGDIANSDTRHAAARDIQGNQHCQHTPQPTGQPSQQIPPGLEGRPQAPAKFQAAGNQALKAHRFSFRLPIRPRSSRHRVLGAHPKHHQIFRPPGHRLCWAWKAHPVTAASAAQFARL